MRLLLSELQHAWRRAVASAGSSLATFVTLAIALAALVAVFSGVDSVLLKPLPFPESDRLVVIRHAARGLDRFKNNQSEASYVTYRSDRRVFDDVGAYIENVLSLTDENGAEMVATALVTPSLLQMLRVTPIAGRLFTDQEGAAGAARVVLISHALWQRRYGADPGVVGRQIALNQLPCTIVGILPSGFGFPRRDTAILYNLPIAAAVPETATSSIEVVGRLKRGVTPADAGRDLQQLLPAMAARFPQIRWLAPESQPRVAVEPLKDFVVAPVSGALWALFTAASFLMLVAWANVANVFLVRGERRKPEVAVRRALGATPGTLLRGFILDGALVTMPAAVAAAVVALAAVKWQFGFTADQLPRLNELRIAGSTWWLMAVVIIVTILLVAGASFWQATRGDVLTGLRAGRRTSSGSGRLRGALVALQVAMSIALLAGSLASVRSFMKLNALAHGFRIDGIVTARVTLPARGYSTYSDVSRFVTSARERLEQGPGIDAVGATSLLPLTPPATSIIRPFVPNAAAGGSPDRRSLNAIVTATPTYFDTLRIPLTAGRTFRRGDANLQKGPVILSAHAAADLFGGLDPIGQEVHIETDPLHKTYTVVGTVGDVQSDRPAEPQSIVYFPFVDDLNGTSAQQFAPRTIVLVIATRLAPSAVAPTLKEAVNAVDRSVPVADVQGLEVQLQRVTASLRITMTFLALAAGATFFLGLVGIHAVVSYTVVMRRREIGIRLALGAEVHEIVRMILRQNLVTILMGVAAGVLAAFALARMLASTTALLDPWQPLIIGAIAVVMLAIAVAATYVPARRVADINPLEVLSSAE
jgi:putative ABC transport system permease protein